MSKELVIGGIAFVLAVSALVVGGNEGPRGQDGKDGVSVGAVPVLNSPLDLVSGGSIVGGGSKLIAGSRTMYSIRTGSATTTGTLHCSIQNQESYAVTVRMGWGPTIAAGTTTPLSDFITLASGQGWDLTASSSDFIAPGSVVVLNLAATTTDVSATHNPVGGCTFLGSSY